MRRFMVVFFSLEIDYDSVEACNKNTMPITIVQQFLRFFRPSHISEKNQIANRNAAVNVGRHVAGTWTKKFFFSFLVLECCI